MHPLDWVSSHPFQYSGDSPRRYTPEIRHAHIGHDVWIGHSAIVLAGVSIGTGAVIATRSIVTQDVPPYAIVAGTPARILRFRHDETLIQQLLASHWWNHDITALQQLPLDMPQAFLDAFSRHEIPEARYPRIRLNRRGASRIDG